MKKVSDVFKSIRFAKLDPHHDKGPKGSTDDEEHYTISSKEYGEQLKHVKKRAMMTTEAKDESEYGYEGDMAINQLETVIRHATYLKDMMKPDTDLPEWVQSKITLATDYLQTACDYLTSEMNEGHQVVATTKQGETFKSGIHPTKEKALSQHYKMAKSGNFRKIDTVKTEEVQQIEEGRPSQRHPLEGHEYHKKSDDALIHIAKDAHAAAEAMKGHNTTAENKYRDQANDSATVRHFRKTSGMPDWYKKKYGHMKEEKDTTPPFDGPYTKKSPVATDKSGAKHGPMSVARHLAKQAMQRQSASLKKPVKEQAMSNKAKIVKDAAKKKTGESEDKFQSEPIMTKSPTKNY